MKIKAPAGRVYVMLDREEVNFTSSQIERHPDWTPHSDTGKVVAVGAPIRLSFHERRRQRLKILHPDIIAGERVQLPSSMQKDLIMAEEVAICTLRFDQIHDCVVIEQGETPDAR